MTIYEQKIQKSILDIKLLRLILIAIISTLSMSTMADDISFQDREPSSYELINAFLGQKQQSAVISQEPKRTVKFRGISLKKSTPASKPVEKTMYEGKNSFEQQVSENELASACMAGKRSVAVSINFSPNSSSVTNTTLIKNIAQAMNNVQLSKCYFIIEGHTDATGNDYYNLWLSQQRAGEVKTYLSQHNVTADRLIVVGRGEDDLLNTKNPGSKENRRVVFKVINHHRYDL